jgi:methyl-accepting chemotaxis protein
MNWEEIYGGIRAFAGRAATKINQTADMATLQVKLTMAQNRLEEAYTALGRASFGHFVEDKDNFDEISALIVAVKNAMLDIRDVEAQIEDLRRRATEAANDVENFKGSVAEVAAEAAQAHKAAKEAEKDAEERAAAVRKLQEERAEPLEVFDFEEEDFITNLSKTDDAIEIELESED